MGDSYGVVERTDIQDDVARAAEEIALRGYSIFPPLFSSEEVATWRDKIDAVYARQESEFTREGLAVIGETDICRAPLLYDFSFVNLACNPTILTVARHILGDWIILHLQNAIINRPDAKHHQSAWHRDLPYQNWTISKPLSLSAIVAIDDFSAVTGGTRMLPCSHRSAAMPSPSFTEENSIDCEAPAGSVILFDSMLFHQAGSNKSGKIRRAVNHVYTAPILKQQYDFPRALSGKAVTDEVAQLLGMTSQVPLNDSAWRKARAQRMSAK